MNPNKQRQKRITQSLKRYDLRKSIENFVWPALSQHSSKLKTVALPDWFYEQIISDYLKENK